MRSEMAGSDSPCNLRDYDRDMSVDAVSPDPERRVRFAVEMARGATVPSAASSSGVSERTAHRWLRDPTVKADIDAHRAEMRSAAVGVWSAAQVSIAASGLTALRELTSIVKDERASFASRVQAGKALLDHWDRSMARATATTVDAVRPDDSDPDVGELVRWALADVEVS
jgi:hypothetical protein